MHGCWRWNGVRISIPAEERAESEMLHDGEFGQDFCVVHFDHTLALVLVHVLLLMSI